MRFVQASSNECMFPVAATAISRYTEHLDTIISTIGPVEIVVDPIKRKATDQSRADGQHRRCAVIGTQVFPANTLHKIYNVVQ